MDKIQFYNKKENKSLLTDISLCYKYKVNDPDTGKAKYFIGYGVFAEIPEVKEINKKEFSLVRCRSVY